MTAQTFARFSFEKLSTLWVILSKQIELGDLNLKHQSVLLAAALIKLQGFPNNPEVTF
jgi:hypothetical protein